MDAPDLSIRGTNNTEAKCIKFCKEKNNKDQPLIGGRYMYYHRVNHCPHVWPERSKIILLQVLTVDLIMHETLQVLFAISSLCREARKWSCDMVHWLYTQYHSVGRYVKALIFFFFSLVGNKTLLWNYECRFTPIYTPKTAYVMVV